MTTKKYLFYLILSILSFISISGALVYRFYALNWAGIIIALIIAIIGIFLFNKSLKLKITDAKYQILDIKNIIFLAIYFLLFAFSLLVLFQARTDQALTSPWQVVSTKFFIAYILATAYLVFYIFKKNSFSLFLISAHYLLSFSILWIIFKFGYGYDPLIHQTTLSLIDKQGFVDPKPFYYLGQYSLVLIAHKLFFIPISWLDKLLVPVLSAILIPSAIYLFLKKYINNSSQLIRNLSLLILLILPFSIFTLTVPQNLAYLFLLLTIFIGLSAQEKSGYILTCLLAITTMLVHPIAGIPAILFASAIFLLKSKIKIKKIILGIILALTIILPPLSFYLADKSVVGSENITEVSQNQLIIPSFIFPQKENIFLNFIYFFASNAWFWLSLLVIVSFILIFIWRKKYPLVTLSTAFSASLLIAYLLAREINFNFLISYERSNYSDRLLVEAFLFLLPVIAIIFYKLLKRILEQNKFIKIFSFIFLILLISVSLFSSYPRRDNYFNSHSFSVGQSDFEAINWIDKDANNEKYVVLANQQVSALALNTFGFNHYLKNDLYFYPIPTGGPLYKFYLNMVYDRPNKETMQKAMDLANVKTAYFVINKYWTEFDKIVEEAKMETSSYRSFNNNEVYVFKYTY